MDRRRLWAIVVAALIAIVVISVATTIAIVNVTPTAEPTKQEVISEALELEGCPDDVQTVGRQVCSQELPAPNPGQEEPLQRTAPDVAGLGSSNGRIPASELSPATGCVTGLAARAAAAWNHVAVRTHRATGYWLQSNGPASCYRTFAQQVELKNYWCSHGACGNAATPGFSNHGWAIAIDAPPATVAAIHRFGGRYFGQGAGSCSDAPWESWHVKYCGGYGGRDPGPYGRNRDRFKPIQRGDKGKRVKSVTSKLAVLRRTTPKHPHYIAWKRRGRVCRKPCAAGIRKFQKDCDLGVDGVFGTKSNRCLNHRWAVHKRRSR